MKTRVAIGAVLLALAFALPKSDALISMLPKTQPDAPAVTVVPEDQVWEELAAWAEAGELASTDELLRVVRALRDRGLLSDISRTDKFKSVDGPITPHVVEVLRQ